MKILVILITSLLAYQSGAESHFPQSPDAETLKQLSQHNLQQAVTDRAQGNLESFRSFDVVPFAEYEKTGYVFFNDSDYFGYATEIKRKIAENLPQGVSLVVYTTSKSPADLRDLRTKYKKYIEEDRLIILQVPPSGRNNFWTRDNLPLPVWTEGQFTLVDARYYYNFEPDAFLVNLFGALTTKHNYFFEGGNFIANSRGECIVVNRRRSYPGGVSDTGAIPDEIFKNQYGCKKLTRFRHLKGIGHADEVVKFISDDVIVTDTPEYVETLEKLGYDVHLLPEADLDYETYANSLQVNDVLFVPSFGEKGDQKAVDLYQKLNPNLKIVTIPTRRLATGGQGGIHCITMNYPDVPFAEILQTFRGTIVD